MIYSVDNVNFKGLGRNIKIFLPRKLVGYSTHTPKPAEIPYGYYMPQFKKSHPIKNFFNRMIENFKGLKETMRSEYKKAKNDKNLKEFSTIEKNGTGMFFEA